MASKRRRPVKGRVDASVAVVGLTAVGAAAEAALDQHGTATLEAIDLLGELLAAFDLPRARRAAKGRRKTALRGLPADAGTPERFARERLTMLPTLRKLVGQVRVLRASLASGPLPSGAELDGRRTAIARSWTTALAREGATELPPLCEVCCLPVLMRQPERGGTLSTVCSDACRDARKKRRHRKRQ